MDEYPSERIAHISEAARALVASGQEDSLRAALQAVAYETLSRRDTLRWHAGELTEHMQALIAACQGLLGAEYDRIEIWGVQDERGDEEPLTVRVFQAKSGQPAATAPPGPREGQKERETGR